MGKNTTRIRLRVHGRVQGVGFRYFVEREALRAGLCGWVRNLPDGSVEVEADGERTLLAEFAAAVRRGPSLSRVTGVDDTWSETTSPHAAFRVRNDLDP